MYSRNRNYNTQRPVKDGKIAWGQNGTLGNSYRRVMKIGRWNRFGKLNRLKNPDKQKSQFRLFTYLAKLFGLKR